MHPGRYHFLRGLNRQTWAPDDGLGSGSGGSDAGAGASGDSGGQGNNQGGNSGTQNNTGGTQNNTGNGFDPATFWSEPKPAASGSPSGGSADSSAAGGGTQPNEAQRYATEFQTRLQGLDFGTAFTPEIATQVAEGNFVGINKAIGDQLKSATQNSVVMAAQLMQRNNESLLGQVRQLIADSLGTRDNQSTLLEHFPSAKDPAIRPQIESVFNQALKLSNGDRTKAVETAKIMLQYMGKNAAGDLGISTPPPNPGDTMTDNARGLVEELLGRR